MKPLRALIVSYVFPPVGGAGVQRVLKLVKYLPEHGVQPTVLTAKDPSVPLQDQSLQRDIPPGLPVVRARTFEPAYGAKKLAWQAAADDQPAFLAGLKRRSLALARQLLLPDPQLLWLPGAHLALANQLMGSQSVDIVFISGPPFSQFLLAFLARLRPNTAVVLDYRDEWTMTASSYEMSTSARVSERLERAVLRQAHAVTTATEEFRASLLSRFPKLEPDRVHAIPNGYDSADFPETLPEPPAERFVLTYCGTVFRLTSASGFLAGLERLHASEPQLAKHLDVRFIGRIVDTEARAFEGTEALGVSRLGYVEHSRALSLLASSHAALCILDEVPGVERIYPAKIFEIMRAGRPCLALTPEGALARLVRRHGLGDVVPPRDPNAIAAALTRMLRAFVQGVAVPHTPVDIDRFDRRVQAGRFAQVFRAAHARATESPGLSWRRIAW
jgi:glycosyltransferase involved in cell wall biosynthesis